MKGRGDWREILRECGLTRGDLRLTGLLLGIAAGLGLLLLLAAPAPRYVTVRVDGTQVLRVPLSRDGVYPIGETNTITVSDGEVRMTHADCPDQICVKTGGISHSGQSIVCAPNRVVVSITGGDSDDSDDTLYTR